MAGRKPAVPDAVVREWQLYRDQRLSEGISLWRLAAEIASSSGCYETRTVYFYLNPSARAKEQELDRNRHRRRAARLKTQRETARRYKKRWGAEHRDTIRAYQRNYHRLARNPERYISSIFSTDSELDIDAITTKLAELSEGLRFRPSTVESFLYRYNAAQREGRIRGPPLREIVPGVWCLSYLSEE